MKPIKFVHIHQPNGCVFEIPVEVIAANRAAYYHDKFKESEFPTLESAREDTDGLFADDAYEIKDWAANNMNWDELQQHARLVRFTPPDMQWQDGEWTYHEHRSITGELDADTVMKVPLELVATTMIEAQQLCNVTVLNAQDGKPFGAVAVVIGSPEVVQAYLTTLGFTTQQLTQGQPAPAVN